MKEILKKNEELKAQRDREQKIIDDTYCRLVQQELEYEKSQLQSDKVKP